MKAIIRDFYGWHVSEYLWLAFAMIFIAALSISLNSGTLSLISAVSNVLCVILVAKRRISNYLWGAIGVTLYGYLSYGQHYYGNMLLNWLYYLPLQFVGLYLWRKHMNQKDLVNKKYLNWRERAILLVLLIACVYVFALSLAKYHDPLPLADSYTTIASIIAMLLMINRYAEQWLLWVSANSISVYMWVLPTLHHAPGAAATFAMWVIFLINSIYGLCLWFKSK